MKFFKDFYKYNEEAPKEGSKEWIEQYNNIKNSAVIILHI